jgi:hypothetical protein
MTLTERAGGLLLTRARRGGLTATMAAARSAALSTTLASWARGCWGNGCFSVKDEEDDDDKDDDQDTKKQHSINSGCFVL